MKSLAVDASSAILLYKTKLFQKLIETYEVIMSPVVIEEITQSDHEGSEDFQDYVFDNSIKVMKPDIRGQYIDGLFKDMQKLHNGEIDTILIHLCKDAQAIMLDDGPGAQFCNKMKLPFINALLFPRILFLSGVISEEESEEHLKRLIYFGRYSDDIITFAVNCQAEHVSYFMPDSIH